MKDDLFSDYSLILYDLLYSTFPTSTFLMDFEGGSGVCFLGLFAGVYFFLVRVLFFELFVFYVNGLLTYFFSSSIKSIIETLGRGLSLLVIILSSTVDFLPLIYF